MGLVIFEDFQPLFVFNIHSGLTNGSFEYLLASLLRPYIGISGYLSWAQEVEGGVDWLHWCQGGVGSIIPYLHKNLR